MVVKSGMAGQVLLVWDGMERKLRRAVVKKAIPAGAG